MQYLIGSLFVLACALPLACGDDAVGTAATSSASASTMASTSTATATAGESSSTTATGTTSTSSTAPTSSPTTAPTTDPTTTAPTSSTTAVTDSTTDTGTTTATTTDTGTTTATTGGDDPFICADDKDCTLVNDCCACDPVHVDEPVPECDIQCLQPTCDSVGLAKAKAVCRYGRCTFEKVSCNPHQVSCNALPPECPDFQLPSVGDDDCWTGSCVLPEACDWVPDCDYCGAGMTCVTKLQKGAFSLCEPLPPACGDEPATCECADEICAASPPHIVCHDLDESLGCECPNC